MMTDDELKAQIAKYAQDLVDQTIPIETVRRVEQLIQDATIAAEMLVEANRHLSETIDGFTTEQRDLMVLWIRWTRDTFPNNARLNRWLNSRCEKSKGLGDLQWLCQECGQRNEAAPVKDTIPRRVICDACNRRKHDAWRDREAAHERLAEVSRAEAIAALRALSYAEYLRTDHWQQVRLRALAFAGRRCQLCNGGDVVLDVHHRRYTNLGCEEMDDVIVLCRPCHSHFHRGRDL
jgi:hypothetical protein